MKFDKDALIKHRFWALLAVSAPLALAGIALLLTTVSGRIAAKGAALEGDLKKIKELKSELYNQVVIDKKKEQAEKALAQQNTIWKNAYGAQEDLYQWSGEVERRFNFYDGRFATEIKIGPPPANKEDAPKDTDTLVHGQLTEAGGDEFIVLKDRAGKAVRVQATANARIAEEGGAAGILFEQLGAHVGKHLAVTFQRGKYFNDKLTAKEQSTFADDYKHQIRPILEIVDPLDKRGNGVVQLNKWLYDRADKEDRPPAGTQFLRFVPGQWNITGDISEEAWIAQEDLWIQKEIYRLIRAANDSIGKYARTDKGKETDRKQTYQNPYLALDLELAGDKLKVKMRNRLDRRQKVDQLELLVRFHKDLPPAKVKLSGLPLEPVGLKGDARDEELALGVGQRPGIYGVEQALTWETAAVKRIDQVTVGSMAGDEIAHSHRTYVSGLKPLKEEPKADGADNPMGPMGMGGGAAAPPPVAAGPMGGGRFGPGMGGGGGAGGNKKVLDNGLWTERYLDVSKQARRLPVGVSLIVDQDHVDRVLTAFNNSKLRFLATQVLVNHYPQSLKPQLDLATGLGGLPFAPGAGGMPPLAIGPMPMAGGPMGMGPMGANAAGDTGAAADLEANIELVIYGVVTLYERYPPRPEAPAAEAK